MIHEFHEFAYNTFSCCELAFRSQRTKAPSTVGESDLARAVRRGRFFQSRR